MTPAGIGDRVAARSVLVTGASGLVGCEVVDELARSGLGVVALVHKTSELRLNNGRRLSAGWDRQLTPGAVTLLKGDVSHPSLGLTESGYRQLASSVDLIVHAAAITDFGMPASVYHAVNVQGTANVVAFALQRRPHPIPLLHVSTAYVCGKRAGVVGEADLEADQEFGNPYEESKFKAEILVREAAARGLPAVVARPSIIVGASRSGRIRQFKTIYVVLRVATEGKVRSIPGNYDATLDLVPIDYVASSVVRLALDLDRLRGRTFHLVARRPTTLRDFSDVLAEYPSMHVPRFIQPRRFSVEMLSGLERKYYLRIIRLYESYFARRVEFADDGAREVLGGAAPPSGKPLLRVVINYCERVAYLGRPAVIVSRDSRESLPAGVATQGSPGKSPDLT